ncbi:MAG: hypothetical protein WAN46_16050 [Gammaproteobacteria bacterium]
MLNRFEACEAERHQMTDVDAPTKAVGVAPRLELRDLSINADVRAAALLGVCSGYV